MNALEQLKKAIQGGQTATVEEAKIDDEAEAEEEEEDDYESDVDDYEEMKTSTKRKSSTSHHKDTKRSYIPIESSGNPMNISVGLKKKSRHSSSNESEEDTKSSEPKRRGQVFAKQDDEAKGMQDIKSMFAASKTRNVQKREQVDH